MKINFLPWTTQEKLCSSLLRHSTTTSSLFQIHAFILRNALDTNIQLFTQLIASLSSHIPLLHHARLIFHHRPLHTHDTFLCNIVLRAHAFSDAISLYNDLRNAPDPHRAFSPNAHTFTILLLKSTNSSVPAIQTHVFKQGFWGHSFVSTTLVDLYAKFGEMGCARKVFDGMPEWNPVVWTAMFGGYAKAGDLGIAMEMFRRMPGKDVVSFNAMLDILVKSGDIAKTRNLFDQIPEKNVVSWTCLLRGYCKAGDLESARRVFDEMPGKNVVSWNTMINGYYRNRKLKSTLTLFLEFHSTPSSSGFGPNSVTLISVLPAIADLGALEIGRQIHQYIQIHNLLDATPKIRTSLIDMYAKCGDIKSSLQIFQTTKAKQSSTSTYNAMINALAITGHVQSALALFSEMGNHDNKNSIPDTTTMIAVLSACAHGGCITQGTKLFREMESAYGISPQVEHYGCMVDLLGRSGRLREAEALVNAMPVKVNGVIVSSLLYGCGVHGDVERAERVMKTWGDLEEWNAGNYVTMRNLYLKKKMWGKAEETARKSGFKGDMKEVGVSYVVVRSRVGEFASGGGGAGGEIEKEVVGCVECSKLHMEEQ